MTPKEKAEYILSILDIKQKEDIDVDLISHFFGIYIAKRSLTGCSAKLTCSKRSARITVSNAEKYEPRVRFSIAHELGHFFLHKHQKALFSCSSDDMYKWVVPGIEVEANTFAANMLMPESIFRKHVSGKEPSVDLVLKTSNDFCTSLTSTLIRYVECSFEPLALVHVRNGIIAWSKRNKDFTYFLKGAGCSLHEHSYAIDCFQKGKSNAAGRVPAYAWIDDYKVDNDSMIHEISFYSPALNWAYSLLWVDDDIERYQ